MGAVVNFAERSGFHRFTCTGCDAEVLSYCPPDLEPVCLICRFTAAHPELPGDVIARLRNGNEPPI